MKLGKNFYAPIELENKKEFKSFKKMDGAYIRLRGSLNWSEEVMEFSPRALKLKIKEFEEITLAQLGVPFSHEPMSMEEVNHYLLGTEVEEEKGYHGREGVTFRVGDRTANAMIAGGGLMLMLSMGPISLIPAGLLGLKLLLND